MDQLMQVVLTGLTLGATYGLIGVGYVVIYRMTGMVNFAQGDIAMAGAFGAVVAAHSMPSLFAALIGGAVGAVLALFLYVVAIKPLQGKGLLVQTIVTLAAAIVIRSVVQLVFGSKPYTMQSFSQGSSVTVLGGSIPIQGLWLLLSTAVLYVALTLFFDRMDIGKALSACAINPYAARVVGISLPVMATIAFAVSGGVSGFIGAASTPLAVASVSTGLVLSLKGFIAAILGGFEKIGLTIVGGLLVGIAETLVAVKLSTSYQEMIIMILLVVLLVARPAGLTRMKVTNRV